MRIPFPDDTRRGSEWLSIMQDCHKRAGQRIPRIRRRDYRHRISLTNDTGQADAKLPGCTEQA